MKNLKLIKLQKKEMNLIVGGEDGGGSGGIQCKSCLCSCGEGDTTRSQVTSQISSSTTAVYFSANN